MGKKETTNQGFSIVEVMLAVFMFAIIAVTGITTILHSYSVNRLGEEETFATLYAGEGMEAVRSIKNQGWSNLSAGTLKLRRSNGFWEFNGPGSDTDPSGRFTRSMLVSTVNRDVNGNIVSSGGTTDPDTKKVTAEVNWNFSDVRARSITLSNYVTNFRKAIATEKGGVLVYGDGGTTLDTISYKILDASGTWGAVQLAADIDGTTNRVLRAVRLYASPTRNEKIMISRHYNGATQYIYAQVHNGTGWGNVNLLAFWNSTSFLDVRNFDGTYLANGDFMAVYSNNSTTPRYRVWNGTSWSGQLDTRVVGGIPTYIVARRRPGTTEAMVAVFDQTSDTNTEYFNLGTNNTYELADWILHAQHSGAAPANNRELVDFAWSPNASTKGALVYSNAGTDTRMNIKIWTANGTGGGSWTGTVDAPAQSRLVAVSVEGRIGGDEFIACATDTGEDIRCYESNFTPAWTTPTNYIIETTTDTGNQRSFQVSYEATSGERAIVVYSDRTAVPKLKQYNPSTNTWDPDSSQVSLNTLGGALKTVRMTPQGDDDDIMVLMGDANLDFYSIVWDGTNNSVYSLPSGKAFSAHGLNGSNTADLWYDFEWDRF